MPEVFARMTMLGSAVVCGVLVAGCGSSSNDDVNAAASTPVRSDSTSTGVGVSPSATPITTPVASTSSKPSTPASTAISIPPYLCDATDIAQNAADAYMGALSAGDEKQAGACVLPNAVPAATTHSLVATVKGTAVYMPRDGVDGPAVFGYQGNGKSIDVTVTKEKDGKFWITKVTIRNV